MAQFGRPDGEITAGAWSPSGVDTLVHQPMDETVADDDTSYNAATAGTTGEVSLSNVVDPVSSAGHAFRFRARSATAAGSKTLTVALYQGSTLIATSAAISTNTTSWTTTTVNLSGAEADSITNYNDLRLRFIAGGTFSGTSLRVTWMELEVPDAPVAGNHLRMVV